MNRLIAPLLLGLLMLPGCAAPAAEPTPAPPPTAAPTATPAPLAVHDLSGPEGYTESFLTWVVDGADCVACCPVRQLRQDEDPSDPWQAESPGYGCGPRTAFRAADGSWDTGFVYYTGFAGCAQMLSPSGILVIKDRRHWAMLDYKTGREKYEFYRDDALALYHDVPMSNGLGALYGEEGATFFDLETGEAVPRGDPRICPPARSGQSVVQDAEDRWRVVDLEGNTLLEVEGYDLQQYGGRGGNLYLLSDGGWSTRRWYDGALNPQPTSIGGHTVLAASGGWLWYDDGTEITLFRGEERHTLPTGFWVMEVDNGLALLKHGVGDAWNPATAVYTLDGDAVIPYGSCDRAALITDVVSGKSYLQRVTGGHSELLSPQGEVLCTLPGEEPTATEIALALGFTPDPATGALLVAGSRPC